LARSHGSRPWRGCPVTDQLGPIGVATNGKGKKSKAEPTASNHEGPPSLSARSVDERLDALMETIRTWDWRAPTVEAGPPPTDETTLTVSHLATTATAEAREDLKPRTFGSSTVQVADTPSVVLESTPQLDTVEPGEPVDPTADTRSVVLEPTPPPVTVDPAVPVDPDDASDYARSLFEPRPKRRAETRRGLIGRLWSHRWTKVTVLFLAAAVAVILIVWALRIANNNAGSGNSSFAPPTTATTRSAASPTTHPALVAPITAAEMTLYKGYAAGLQTANNVAAKAFVHAGSTPTTAQLEPVITAYGSALNLYDFQLHFIQWPASMLSAIQLDHLQFKTLMSDLQSYSSVNPAGTSAWLTGFHSQAATTQAADNEIRKDLGLPSSSSFP